MCKKFKISILTIRLFRGCVKCERVGIFYAIILGMKKGLLLILTILLMSTTCCMAKHLKPEKEYQREWCATYSGVTEYVLDDKTRVDCLTKNYAIEFDFAQKWAEAVGQAYYYAIKTHKKPAVVIIIEKPSDWKYYYRIKKVADFLKFKLWYVKSKNCKC